MDEILIIDIGGTKTNVSVVNSAGPEINILKSEITSTLQDPMQAIQSIKAIYDSFGAKLNNAALSLPGLWDEHGVLKESYFLHDWLEFPFIETLKKELKIENCAWESDVICAALGEFNALEGNKNASLLYINLGTGAGAALINDGKPFKSNTGATLRIQKLVQPFQDELYSGIDLICGGSLINLSGFNTIEELFERYKDANVEAVDIISKAQFQLASWLINLYYLFAPELIVLGGGLTYDWEVIAEESVDLAKEELEDQVEILPSKLKANAPIYGAYLNYLKILDFKVTAKQK